MSYADEPIYARILTVGYREGARHHSYRAKAVGRGHLRVRRVSPDMRHLAATVHAVQVEAFAGPARR